MLREPAPTRRERRKLFKALRKLRQPTKLVEALNTKAQLQAQRRSATMAERPPRGLTLEEAAAWRAKLRGITTAPSVAPDEPLPRAESRS
jgi:hypothetical protein